MPLVVKDRVKVTSTTTGTGTFTLGSAAAGFQDFSVIGDGNTTYYTISGVGSNEWEVGIGTYTASGTTLSRDVVFESSNSGSLVNFSAGDKDVFVTYPAEKAVYFNAADQVDVDNLRLDGNTLSSTNTDGNVVLDPNGTGSVDVSSAKIINVASPTNANDATNKTYVDSLVSAGVHFHEPVRVEATSNLNATYNNGTAGVGATLTNAGTQVALVLDGVTLSVADRVLIYLQTDQTENGVYVVTDTGSVSTNWILTRASDADTYVFDSPDGLSEGSTFFVQQGDTGAGDTYTCNTPGTIIFGTTNITFVQISSAQIYSAGAGLDLTGTQFSVETNGITNTMLRQSAGLSVIGRSSDSTGDVADVTAASDHQVLRRSGTSIGFGAIDLSQTNAITGDLPLSNLAQGSALSVLGVTGDATADNASIAAGSDHQVLRRSGTSVAFGAVALNQSNAVTGTLPAANGGTGVTSLGSGVGTWLSTPSSANLAAAVTDETGTGALVFANTPSLISPVLGTPTSGTLSNCTVDGTTNVGFISIPQNSQSANYTLALTDAGKHIFHPATDNNARTFTIPANSSVAFPIGTAVTFINMASANVTIAITTDTLTFSPSGSTGSRTLAIRGSATAIKITATQWLISGSAIT
jgi:hypothetical protein